MPDGSLLISDDEVGALYRVTYNASNVNNPSSPRIAASQGPGQTSGAAAAAMMCGGRWFGLLVWVIAAALAQLI
jgi:hypothetical protein